MTEDKKDESGESAKKETSAVEWIFAGIGLIIVVGVVGFLIYEAVTRSDSPPDISIEIESIEPVGKNFLVKFAAKNNGETNAADVVVEGKLKRGAEDIETSSVTMDYAPSESARQGGLLFTKNPQEFQLEMRAVGYNEP